MLFRLFQHFQGYLCLISEYHLANPDLIIKALFPHSQTYHVCSHIKAFACAVPPSRKFLKMPTTSLALLFQAQLINVTLPDYHMYNIGLFPSWHSRTPSSSYIFSPYYLSPSDLWCSYVDYCQTTDNTYIINRKEQVMKCYGSLYTCFKRCNSLNSMHNT